MFLSADKIHDGKKWLPQNTVIEIDESGVIIALHSHLAEENIEHYEGILCPGFVNVHCHTELSHLKDAVAEHTGLTQFLQQVMQRRNDYSEEQKTTAREAALQELERNGIVALGDIANTTDTLALRQSTSMHWHTFVEAIGFVPERAAHSFDYAQQTYSAFALQKSDKKILQQSIVPHAPYSVSQALFQQIAAQQSGKSISIHNQESAAENELYQSKTGAFLPFLNGIGIDTASFSPSGKNSLPTYGEWLGADAPLILVHNTYTSQADIDYAQARFPQLYWCLCPNANLYIENTLPNIPLLQASDARICLGTDSLASNHQLSILAEMRSIQQHYPQIDWETLLRWATYNGACALQMQASIGSIEVHKKPGILWIKEDDSLQKLY